MDGRLSTEVITRKNGRSRRQVKVSKIKINRFLRHYATGATLTESYKVSGLARSTYRDLRDNDEEFAEWLKGAEESSTDLMLTEAFRRGVRGVPEPTGWYKGDAGGTVQRYSDNLLMFLLKERRPEFRDKFELTGQGGQPLQIQLAAYTAPEGISNRTSQKQKPKEPDPGAPPAIEVEAKDV